jgi:hypothetical protein
MRFIAVQGHLPQPGTRRLQRDYAQQRVDIQPRQSSFGMIRLMNSSNSGTVNVVSPWFGLQVIPLEMS